VKETIAGEMICDMMRRNETMMIDGRLEGSQTAIESVGTATEMMMLVKIRRVPARNGAKVKKKIESYIAVVKTTTILMLTVGATTTEQ